MIGKSIQYFRKNRNKTVVFPSEKQNDRKGEIVMKKGIALLLAGILLCTALAGCGRREEPYGEEPLDAKPVIYLYPERETPVTVALDYDGEITAAYPAFDGLWQVTAAPDGTLTDARGVTYNYLYWEGLREWQPDFSRGFVVAGEDTASFLEGALAQLGLTRREANEFIVYWLPLLQDSPYNLIAFQTEAYTDHAALTVTPEPDTVIRVFMACKALEAPVQIEPQSLSAPDREGFVLVEWGGARIG